VTRMIGSLLLLAAVGITLAAQEPGAKDAPKEKEKAPGLFDNLLKGLFGGKEDQKDDAAPKNQKDVKDPKDAKKDAELAPMPDAAPANAENPDDIIKRLKKNFNTTEERLDKKDPGAETRKLQEQIIEDIDKLLKQQQDNQNNSGGGGGGGGASSSSSGASGGSSSRNKGQSNQNDNQAANKSGGQDKQDSKDKDGKDKDGKGGKDGKDQAKNGGQKKDDKGKGDQAKDKDEGGKGEQKKDKDELAKNAPPPKDDGKKKKEGGDGGGGDSNQKKPPTVGDLYKNVWGHLPEKKRQEMDAYGRESFPRKYEQLLREYYRTIAEQRRVDE
jgi:hypothetical protein